MRQGPGSHRGATSDKKKKHIKKPQKQIDLTDMLRDYIVKLKEERKQKKKDNRLSLSIVGLMKQFKVKEGDVKKSLIKLYQENLVGHEYRGYVYVPEEKINLEKIPLTKLFCVKRCPICDKKLEVLYSDDEKDKPKYSNHLSDQYAIKCNSKCFEYAGSLSSHHIQIFDKKFRAAVKDKGQVDYIYHEALKEIKYWKKNYRYVVKFLEES